MFIVSGERPMDDRLIVSILGYLLVVESSRAIDYATKSFALGCQCGQ
jgi:hypothetical protein